ncbi:pentapeptide repeat protein [Xylanimonas cellulosilytica DSM 15894]|uniref:Pentapeptide repeat protein n=1 Tax=Xylanimonas cellulosilytica (strain DSM 15894 / JCM 12276 / CECT 5975 / KCTC 9989 / LMG 20990 / NBRC 107835 / XIL07) TaxID=446471 RepID=D1BYQ1_XYLCX|nr:DinB family protein [Xylanimonas cellulosilytica]ACZ29976.1 pentapeptide repeat protein [Xylanimonas cellulosilytica DSM 15894]
MEQPIAADDLRGAQFVEVDMQGARFRLADLSGARFDQSYLTQAVLRGVDLSDAEIDGELDGLVLNGVAVAPLIEAALDERFPGRAGRRSSDPTEQLAAFDAAQARWAEVVERATARPGLRDARVGGEWSVSETLRHLVLATDAWLRLSVLGLRDAFCPIGVLFTEWEGHAAELGIDPGATPSWEEVLAARADRVAQVRAFLAAQTAETFARRPHRLPPWDEGAPGPDRDRMTVGRCLGVIGNEEWEHLRFALRDLDALAAGDGP